MFPFKNADPQVAASFLTREVPSDRSLLRGESNARSDCCSRKRNIYSSSLFLFNETAKTIWLRHWKWDWQLYFLRKKAVNISKVLQRRCDLFARCVSTGAGRLNHLKCVSPCSAGPHRFASLSSPNCTRAGFNGVTPRFLERGILTLLAAMLKWPWVLEMNSELTLRLIPLTRLTSFSVR